MLAVIYSVIIWIVIPLIMLAIFFFSIFLATRAEENSIKISAGAGFWAGLLFFVIHVVSELQNVRSLDIKTYQLPQFSWLPLISGIVIGFLLLWGIKFFLPTRFIGLLTLILSFVSSAALFDYLFVLNTRDLALFIVLGLAAGILIHLVVFPESIRSLVFSRPSPRY